MGPGTVGHFNAVSFDARTALLTVLFRPHPGRTMRSSEHTGNAPARNLLGARLPAPRKRARSPQGRNHHGPRSSPSPMLGGMHPRCSALAAEQAQIEALGISPQRAREAVIRFDGNLERAAAWLFSPSRSSSAQGFASALPPPDSPLRTAPATISLLSPAHRAREVEANGFSRQLLHGAAAAAGTVGSDSTARATPRPPNSPRHPSMGQAMSVDSRAPWQTPSARAPHSFPVAGPAPGPIAPQLPASPRLERMQGLDSPPQTVPASNSLLPPARRADSRHVEDNEILSQPLLMLGSRRSRSPHRRGADSCSRDAAAAADALGHVSTARAVLFPAGLPNEPVGESHLSTDHAMSAGPSTAGQVPLARTANPLQVDWPVRQAHSDFEWPAPRPTVPQSPASPRLEGLPVPPDTDRAHNATPGRCSHMDWRLAVPPQLPFESETLSRIYVPALLGACDLLKHYASQARFATSVSISVVMSVCSRS